VNGQTVDAAKNVLGYFENMVRSPAKITAQRQQMEPAPAHKPYSPRTMKIGCDVRTGAEGNRKLGDNLSGGRLGYIFLSNATTATE
jgi:hypothetical protein